MSIEERFAAKAAEMQKSAGSRLWKELASGRLGEAEVARIPGLAERLGTMRGWLGHAGSATPAHELMRTEAQRKFLAGPARKEMQEGIGTAGQWLKKLRRQDIADPGIATQGVYTSKNLPTTGRVAPLPIPEAGHTVMASVKTASGDTTQIDAMPATEMGHEGTTKRLEELFEARDGLAQNAKKDLSRFFDTKNPMYAMRKQSLIDKVAHVLQQAKGSK